VKSQREDVMIGTMTVLSRIVGLSITKWGWNYQTKRLAGDRCCKTSSELRH